MAFSISYNITAIDRFTKVSNKIKTSAVDLEKCMAKLGRSGTSAAKGFDKVQVSLTGTKSDMDKSSMASAGLTTQMKKTNMSARSLTKANKATANSEKELAKQAKLAEKALAKQREKMRALASVSSNVGRQITTKVALPMVAAGGASIKFAMDFNKSMASVGTLIPGQDQKLMGFKKQVQALSMETGQSTGLMADGLYQVISAIGDTSDSMAVLRISARAATAGVAETKDSVNLLTKVSSAYGDTSAEMIQKVSDVSFLAVKLGVTTFPELANSMGRISATSNTMGVSLEELYADTAALTKVMGDTSQAATSMDAVMGALMVGGGDLDKVFKKIGVKSGKELIQSFGGLQGALFKLKAEMGGDELKMANLFGRKEAQKAAVLLTNSMAKDAANNFKKMKNAAGATDEAYKAQTEGVNKMGFKWEQTKQKMMVFAQRAGDMLLPVLDRVLTRLEPVFKWLENVDQGTIDASLAFGKFAISAGLLFTGLGKIMTISNGVQDFMRTMSSDVAGLASNAGNATGKTKGLAKQLLSMKGAVGVLGAAAMGYSIGQLINEAVMDPRDKGYESRERGIVGMSHKTMMGGGVGAMTDVQLQQNLAEIKGLKAALPKNRAEALKSTSYSEFQAIGAMFSDDIVDPFKEVQGQYKEAVMNQYRISEEIKRREAARTYEGGDMEGVADMKPQKVELTATLKAAEGTEIIDTEVKGAEFAQTNVGKNQ